MKRLFMFLILAANLQAISPQFHYDGNLTLRDLQQYQNMINADLYRRLGKTNITIKEISASTVTLSDNLISRRLFARDIRTEQYGNMTDDDVQGQLFDLDEWKLHRKSAAKKYLTVDRASTYWSDGTTDNAEIHGTTGRSQFRGSMIHYSTNSYWTTAGTNTIEISGLADLTELYDVSSEFADEFEVYPDTVTDWIQYEQYITEKGIIDGHLYVMAYGNNNPFFEFNRNKIYNVPEETSSLTISTKFTIKTDPFNLHLFGFSSPLVGQIGLHIYDNRFYFYYYSDNNAYKHRTTTADIHQPGDTLFVDVNISSKTLSYSMTRYRPSTQTKVTWKDSAVQPDFSNWVRPYIYMTRSANGGNPVTQTGYIDYYREIYSNSTPNAYDLYVKSTIQPVVAISTANRGLGVSAGDDSEVLISALGGMAIYDKRAQPYDYVTNKGADGGKLAIYTHDTAGVDFYVGGSTYPQNITYNSSEIVLSTTTRITGDLHAVDGNFSGNNFVAGYSSTTGNNYTTGDSITTGDAYAETLTIGSGYTTKFQNDGQTYDINYTLPYSTSTDGFNGYYLGYNDGILSWQEVSTATYAVNAGTAVYADNAGLFNGNGTDYFATASDLSDTAASTGTIYTALQSTGAALSSEIERAIVRENEIAVSTGMNYEDIKSTGAALTAHTGDSTVHYTQSAISISSSQVSGLESVIVDTASYAESVNYNILVASANYVTGSISSATWADNAGLLNGKSDTDFLISPATFTYVASETDPVWTSEKTDYASLTSSPTWTGQHNFMGGNVGIGTTTTLYKLDVNGTGRFTGAVSVSAPTAYDHAATRGYVDDGYLTKSSATATYLNKLNKAADSDKLDGLDSLSFIKKDGSVAFTGTINTNNQWISGDGGSEGLYVDTSGRVGANNSNPSAAFSDADDLVVGPYSGGRGITIAHGQTTSGYIAFSTTTVGNGQYKGMVQYYTSTDPNAGGFRFWTKSVERAVILDNGNVGLNDITPSYALDVNGTGRFTGKLTLGGGSDPPYTHHTAETRQSTIDRVSREVPPSKMNGAVMFFNSKTNMMEIYRPDEGKFYDFSGVLLTTITPVSPAWEYKTEYYLDEFTGEIMKDELPVNEVKWKLEDGVELSTSTGRFYKNGIEIEKAKALKKVKELE